MASVSTPSPPAGPLPKPPRRLPASLEANSGAPVIFGILLCAAGFFLIAYCWSQVGLRMSVAEQVPYIVSSGFTGLGLIVVGSVTISIQVRRRDAEHHLARLDQIASGARKGDPIRIATAGTTSRARFGRRPIATAVSAGVLVVVAGFALLAIAWMRTSVEPSVSVQMPYLVSGALGGIGLIVIGSVLTHVLLGRGIELARGRAVAGVVSALAGADDEA